MARFAAAFAPLVVAGLLAAPRAAEACSVCFGGRDDGARVAFIATTAFMTALPLLIVGGGFLWLRRQLRRREEEAPGRTAALPEEEVTLRA